MNCSSVREQLSAYFDCELSEELGCEIRRHLEHCDQCMGELNAFQRLATLAVSKVESIGSAPEWNAITTRLDGVGNSVAPVINRRSRNRTVTIGLLALAASFFVVVSLRNNFQPELGGMSQASVATMNLQQVVELFQRDPKLALENLSEQFAGQEVTMDEAEASFGRRPMVKSSLANASLPSGGQLVSTRLLRFPFCQCPTGECTCGPDGCNCVACVCQRPDGSTYLVLEHCKAQVVTFGDLPVQLVNRGNHELQQVTANGLVTISWEGNAGRMTAVGLHGDHEIDMLLASN